MSRNTPAVGVRRGLDQASDGSDDLGEGEQIPPSAPHRAPRTTALESPQPTAQRGSSQHAGLINQVSRLAVADQLALIQSLLAQLDVEQVQTVLEYGITELKKRDLATKATPSHQTRLLLKKDYSYQDRGLAEPTQYYVYLRRRKPKLDRYIGALFYVPRGCLLAYGVDEHERIVFNVPHLVFQLVDATNPSAVQWVRLLYLTPPPPEYTFTKQQNDAPTIHLHVEYLDPSTGQPLMQKAYPFPACMYEGGPLDRYRWEVSTVPVAQSVTLNSREAAFPTAAQSPPSPPPSPRRAAVAPPAPEQQAASPPPRRILELPTAKPARFCLANPNDAPLVLKRLQLWVSWSQKATPVSHWELVQDATGYLLMNAHFKRRILRFSAQEGAIALEQSFPVMSKWFHDLALAVSQTQHQRQYSAAQLKLAQQALVSMSLPDSMPVEVLKQLFGVDFVTEC
jgi:hypothetical protein